MNQMMSDESIKIKELHIQNFKVYKLQKFDFGNDPLIVFDGSNGFGKTTVFDSIELLITGKIRRYNHIKSKLVDRRQARNENPFYCTEGDGGPIEIKATIEYKDTLYVISRKSPNKTNLGNEINFKLFSLHILESIEDVSNDENKENENKLVEILGEHYQNDFEFLHYIEQEDSLYLLKKSEKEKKESIGYLFNTTDFVKKISKFEKIESKINDFYTVTLGENANLKDEIKVIEESLLTENECNFVSLFPEKEFEWDSENVKFDNDEFNRLLSIEDGVLSIIGSLIKNKESFFKEKFNQKIEELVSENNLESFFYYQFFIKDSELLKSEKNIYDYSKNIKEKIDEFDVKDIEKGVYDVPDFILSLEEDLTFVYEYENSIKSLKRSIQQSDSISKTLNKLVTTRLNLVKHQLEYHDKVNDNGICQFCGVDWETKEELIKNIDEQTASLNSFNEELNTELLTDLENFKSDGFIKYLDSIQKIINTFLYDPNYFKDDYFSRGTIREISQTSLLFADLKIEYEELTSKQKTAKREDYLTFLDTITKKKKEIVPEHFKPYYDDIFISYFDENEDQLNEFNIDLIEQKKKFIKWQYSIFQNTTIKTKNVLLTKTKNKLKVLLSNKNKIQKIIEIQKKSLKTYNANIINDIELLFHIYSGRIVQDFQGGLGLFIINKNDKIKFVTSPEKTYDAVFSMSNGQLSALVIAFTLALNKKYSRTNLLFIDDPVQSMDDMNTSGFVEVLRNDFSDRQIFISTHEITMSTYVRYKFEKFNLTAKRFDVSDLPE